MVRAKFRVASITLYSETSRQVKLSAVTADDVEENRRFHKYTPSGTIEMMIDNPPAADQFKLGKMVYVDFTEAPE